MADANKKSDVTTVMDFFKSSTTIQRKYTYLVEFLDDEYEKLISPTQIFSINLQTWSFNKEVDNPVYNPTAVPKMAEDGFECIMGVRENSNGDVRTAIYKLQRRIRKKNGIYNPPNKAKLQRGFKITFYDYAGNPVDVFEFSGLFYLTSEPISMGFDEGGDLQYNITFSVDGIDRKGVEGIQDNFGVEE